MSAPDGGIGMTSARTRDRLVRRLQEQGIADVRVLDRFRAVPRHRFVDEALASRAYEDTALPIGLGQTISQPFVVARMTEALVADHAPDKVLEIGTGCGYQTAVLSPLVGFVSSVEFLAPLLARARQRIAELGIRNVRFRHGDGWEGWSRHGPYDGIIVAAAPERIPTTLLEQLAPGGRLVLPLGPPEQQRLLRVTRHEDGYSQADLGAVRFVPLVRGGAG